jgi:ubiquinone biosynthesis protein COQ4
MKDPDDTVQVLILGLALNAPFFPRFLARVATLGGEIDLLREEPVIDSKTVDFDALRGLPATTLGGAYARYLDDNGLDPDLFQAPPGIPAIARGIARRVRQTHDIWHVLTGYAPDVPGELALQGFTFAQLEMPSSLLIATVGTLVRSPKTFPRVWDGYRRGRRAKFLPPVRFEDRWAQDLDEVRKDLDVLPAAAGPLW